MLANLKSNLQNVNWLALRQKRRLIGWLVEGPSALYPPNHLHSPNIRLEYKAPMRHPDEGKQWKQKFPAGKNLFEKEIVFPQEI